MVFKDYSEAKEPRNSVLKDDPKKNIKGLFSRAQANFGLENFVEIVRDLKGVIKIDPQNRAAHSLLDDAQLGHRRP